MRVEEAYLILAEAKCRLEEYEDAVTALNKTYSPFKTGMLVNGLYMAYAYYPGEYQWGKDFSDFNKENKKISDTEFQLYPVYCLPDYQYGFLNEGAYKLTITMK